MDYKSLPILIKLVIFTILIFLSSGCTSKVKVYGRVLNGFDRPLKDAVIDVEGTSLKIVTNENGEYSADFVPGNVKAFVSREGYSSVDIMLDIPADSVYIAQTVILYLIPDKKGIFLLNGTEYIPLKGGKLYKEIKEFPFTKTELALVFTYNISGELTPIKWRKELKFINNISNGIELLKISPNNIIYIRRTYMSGVKDEYSLIKDKITIIGEDIDLRTVTLEKGEYAFVDKTYYSRYGIFDPVSEPVYLFKVID